MSHHTKDQIQKAFMKASKILAELEEAGVRFPYFLLFPDASGTLFIEKQSTDKQYRLACSLVSSNRIAPTSGGYNDEVGIAFCCGLVDHEEEDEPS